MGFLDSIMKRNEYPIIFIGSGITQRYFENAPTWDELLNQIWHEANGDESYYKRFNQLKKESKDTFNIYTQLATELENKFDDEFYSGNIKLDKLTPQQAHNEQISPFRVRISEIFSDLTPRPKMQEEVKFFKSMVKKARMVVTTNYDCFIEEQLGNKVHVLVGANGLFENSIGTNELYKIHGSITDPGSIVITRGDYEKADRSSVIVNAKILSKLVESPIIFFGYSLTDKNIQGLLHSLAENMPGSISRAAQKIGVVNYEAGMKEVNEVIKDTDFGVHYTQITTDNFAEVYEKIAKINQGITPVELSKYQNLFRQIINEKGKRGQLDKVVTSFVNVDKLPEELKNKNLVVAFGDNRFVYKLPDYVDYVKSYFLPNQEMPIEIALKFILSSAPNSTLPISKYISEISNRLKLSDVDRKKLNQRLKNFQSLDKLNVPNIPNKHQNKLKQLNLANFEEFFNNADIHPRLKFAYVIKQIDNLQRSEVLDIILYVLNNEDDEFIKQTNFRKLLMAYSLKYEPVYSRVD